MNLKKDLTIDILSSVQKPARYTGGEYASIVKPAEEVEATIALAFPDVYEVGMSYLGFKILYHLLNKEDGIAAERVYAPWIDLEAKMREREIVLCTLETKKALRECDIVGFTLQYELSYTNILIWVAYRCWLRIVLMQILLLLLAVPAFTTRSLWLISSILLLSVKVKRF